jgi:diguanylate cyclase (GGDEF)-like protein
MRSNPHPAPAPRDPQLTAARLAGVASALLLGLVLGSGAGASPLLPLLPAAVLIWVRYERGRLVLLAPLLFALLILAGSVRTGLDLTAGVLAALATGAALAPGLYWRREAAQAAETSARLDEAVAMQQRRPDAESRSPAEQAEDLRRALHHVALRLGAESLTLWEVDAVRGRATPVAGTGGRNPGGVRLAGDPMGWAWENRMRLRIQQPVSWSPGGQTGVVDCLRRNDDRGNILTYTFSPGTEPAEELPFEEGAVYLRGLLALYEARDRAAADRRRLRTLLAGLSRTPGELDIDRYGPELCHTAASLVEGTGAALAAWHGDHGTILATTGDDGGPAAGDIFAPPGAELALAIRADTMLVREATSWSLGNTALAHPHERWQLRPRSLAALPLRTVEGTTGVLAVWSSQAQALDPELLELLHMLGPYAAIHLHHALQYGTIKDSAERDPLTTLHNRRGFDRILAAESTRFERYGRPLSLLVLDLDHFKGVNDRFGHEAGDEVLRRTARIIRNCIRDVDTAARLGGEEFVVLMPETGPDAAMDAGERIRTAIAAVPVDWRGSSIPVTVSIGVATAPVTTAAPAGLMAAADSALYAAKAQGRNRVLRGLPAAAPAG